MPLNVTWSDPSGLVMVPSSDADIPVPAVTCAVGTVSGGHSAVQDPVQLVLPVPSMEKW
jgi:hypothetical protein